LPIDTSSTLTDFVAHSTGPAEVIIMRDVHPLTDEQRQHLEHTMKDDPSFRARVRAQSLLLSDQGTTINDIAQTSHVARDTVSTWLKNWEQQGPASWHDKPRRGRPSTLPPDAQQRAAPYLKEEPRWPKAVVDRLVPRTQKHLSISTLKRLAKKARLRWKRGRKSLKQRRDPEACARCNRELEALQQQADQGKSARYSFEEAGFALDPTLPYAWQEPGRVIALPAMR
jgi:transposase